jgi:hypothetical protein
MEILVGTQPANFRKRQKPDSQELRQWASLFYDLYEKEKQKPPAVKSKPA